MKIDMNLILMVLSGATMIIFTLAVLGTALIGKTLFGA